jgi:hypothetical protein
MFPVIEGYSEYHLIQSTQFNDSSIQNSINEFIEIGWNLIGTAYLDKYKFIQLGWLSSKGSPVYPAELALDNQN